MNEGLIEKALAAFVPGRLQELVALQNQLTRAGIGMNDVRRYLDARTAQNAKRLAREEANARRYAKHARRCPACGSGMRLFPVNSGPRDQVGGDWHSQWACPNNACMETIYNPETVGQLLAAMGITPPARPRANPKPQRKPCGGCNGKA